MTHGGYATRKVPFLAVCAAILSWASAYPLVRMALVYVPPIPLAALRYAVAAVIVAGWLCVQRPVRPQLRDVPRFLLCGAVGIALYNILFNTGEQSVSAGATSLLVNFAPFMSAFVAVVFLGESLPLWGWVGSVISFSGIVLIGSGLPGGFTFGSGATDVLAAAFCSALYLLLQRPLVARYGALASTAWILLIGAVVLVPWLSAGLTALQGQGGWPWFLVILLGVFPAVLGYAAWAHVVGAVGVARSSGFLFLLAPTTLILAYVMTHEVPALTTLVGGAVVMAGVLLMQTYGRPRSTPLTLPDGSD
ncbi:DMT family transporter [Acetobacter sp. DsW_54]|uniref:DMT family transporter n=1 Tax=Acetobacter sp. DsW_54 TaxID=1670660 RepID=UPI000A380D60|nr:DMT family transporter [Acetobacter sp. DsW_54]